MEIDSAILSELRVGDQLSGFTESAVLCDGEWSGVAAIGYQNWFVGAEAYAAYQDPAELGCVDTYPFHVQSIIWFVANLDTLANLELVLQPVIYELDATDPFCPRPGAPLCAGPPENVLLTPGFVGTVILPISCCVSGPYFAGVIAPDSIGVGKLAVVIDDEFFAPGVRDCATYNDWGEDWQDLIVDIGFGGNLKLWSEGETGAALCADSDGDGVFDFSDNCPATPNADQIDSDSDGAGDLCDVCPGSDDFADGDADTVPDGCDNCPSDANLSQDDADSDGIGDVCDACPLDADNDADSDGVCGDSDNCPAVANASQTDSDGDGAGDACDLCPGFDDAIDTDGDGNPDGCDSCPTDFDPCGACCAVAGDADNNGSVNIADGTFLLAWIFSGGPGPFCCEQADVNGDGGVNIGDVTALIGYIFSSGAAPVCGPVDLACDSY